MGNIGWYNKNMEKLFIKNQKGQKIATVILRPKTKTGKLAILCPGYLDTKDYEHLIELAKALTIKGYSVVRFDPTGTWESEGDISEYTNTQYLEDIKSVLEYMLKEGVYTHVLLGGHSRGGQLSLLYAARDPRVSVVVGTMPSSGRTFVGPRYKEWKRDGVSVSLRDIPGSTEKREYRVPFSHVTDREKYDVVEDVKNICMPIIFIAGELDDTALPEYVKEIFDAANKPKTYILIKGVGHDYRFNPNEIKIVNEKILKALEKYG